MARDRLLPADELLPLAEAADVLGFGDIQEGDVLLTSEGIQFAEAGVQEDPLVEQLEAFFSPGEARRQLDTVIDWERYAELFGSNDEEGEFFLEEDRRDDSNAPSKPTTAPEISKIQEIPEANA